MCLNVKALVFPCHFGLSMKLKTYANISALTCQRFPLCIPVLLSCLLDRLLLSTWRWMQPLLTSPNVVPLSSSIVTFWNFYLWLIAIPGSSYKIGTNPTSDPKVHWHLLLSLFSSSYLRVFSFAFRHWCRMQQESGEVQKGHSPLP